MAFNALVPVVTTGITVPQRYARIVQVVQCRAMYVHSVNWIQCTYLSCSAEAMPNFTVNKACRPTVLQWQKVYMPPRVPQMAAIAFLDVPVPWYVKIKQIETL